MTTPDHRDEPIATAAALPLIYPLTEAGLAAMERDRRQALRPLPAPGALTWAWLVQAEPLLLPLLSQARRAQHEAIRCRWRAPRPGTPGTPAVRRRRGTPGGGFCANALWYGEGVDDHGLKGLLTALIGHARRSDPDQDDHPDPGPRSRRRWGDVEVETTLRSSEAYDLAYRTIYHALPDCDHPGLCG